LPGRTGGTGETAKRISVVSISGRRWKRAAIPTATHGITTFMERSERKRREGRRSK
jgi:hypothetical protein